MSPKLCVFRAQALVFCEEVGNEWQLLQYSINTLLQTLHAYGNITVKQDDQCYQWCIKGAGHWAMPIRHDFFWNFFAFAVQTRQNLVSWFSVKSLTCLHHTSDFKTKIHQMRFSQGQCPRHHWRSSQSSPHCIWGPTSEGKRWTRGGEDWEEKEGGLNMQLLVTTYTQHPGHVIIDTHSWSHWLNIWPTEGFSSWWPCDLSAANR